MAIRVESPNLVNLGLDDLPWQGFIPWIKDLLGPILQSKKQKRGEMWLSHSYLEQLDKYETSQELIGYISLELRTFFHEYVAFKTIKDYPEFGPRGIKDLAKQNLLEIALATREELIKQSLDNTRASVDIGAMTKLMHFLENETVQTGDVLVYISPRGPTSMYLGYGPEANNYINFYIKESNGKTRLIQVLNYDQSQILTEFTSYLQRQHQAISYLPEHVDTDSNGIPLATQNLTDEHQLVQTVLLIPAGANKLSAIIQQTFQHAKEWQVKIDQFPVLNELHYLTQENFLIDFFAELVTPILEQAAAADPEQKHLLSKKIDALVTVMKRHFLKWTEQNAQNYSQQQHYQIKLGAIKEEWQLICQEIDGQPLNKTQQKQKKVFLGAVALTDATPLKILQHLKFCPPRLSGIFEATSGINGFTNIQLAGQSWKVPLSYLEGKGVYEKNGIAYGPCGVPLDQDPIIAKLNKFNLPSMQSGLANKRHGIKQQLTKADYNKQYDSPTIGLSQFVAGLI